MKKKLYIKKRESKGLNDHRVLSMGQVDVLQIHMESRSLT